MCFRSCLPHRTLHEGDRSLRYNSRINFFFCASFFFRETVSPRADVPRPEIWRRPLGALASLAAVPAAAPTAEEEGNEIDFWKFRRRIWEDWIGAPKKACKKRLAVHTVHWRVWERLGSSHVSLLLRIAFRAFKTLILANNLNSCF